MAKKKNPQRKRAARAKQASASKRASGEPAPAGEAAPASKAAVTSKAAPAKPARAAPIEAPAFWFGFDVSWAKLALGRVILFGMLAVDALLQIRHAPRYGAGDFNVAQLPGLDWMAPGRTTYGIAELVQAYLFVLCACGVGTRVLVPFATVIYARLYFGSQLDSYQHHYLLAIILLLACFVSWQRPSGAVPETRADTRVRTWALRLVLVQLGIMYLWAAISKLDPAWLNGTTLAGQLGGFVRHAVDATIGIRAMSWLVVATEFALAVTVWLRPTWWFAAPVGILFHVGIAFSGLEIGLFAWLMVGLYVFVVPDVIWIWLATAPPRFVRAKLPGIARRARELVTRCRATATRFAIATLLSAVGVGLVLVILACRFESAVGVAIAISVAAAAIGIADAVWRRRERVAWFALAHVLALGTWVVVDHRSTVAFDYYKFWGRTARRADDKPAAEHAYRQLIDIAPGDPLGHFQLARLLLDRGATDDGLAELHAAAGVDHGHARAQIYEARWLATRGNRDAAIAKAREATAVDPNDAEARDLLASLLSGAKLPSRHDDRD